MANMSEITESLKVRKEGNAVYIVFPTGVNKDNVESISELIFGRLPDEYNRICIDLKNLKVINADGLDIIIELKKKCRDITLSNVSSAICETLVDYGFEHLGEIEKNYRFISVAGLETLGEGGHGKVYRLDEDTILKVFTDNCSLEHIENERKYAKNAFMKGIPSPITFDVVITEEGYGLVMEMAGAQTLGKYISEHPDELDEMAGKFADLLILLNNTQAEKGLYGSIKEEYLKRAKNATKWIGEEGCAKLVRMIEAIPEGTSMIHGDYHLGNVMIDKDKNLMIIDMADISYGNRFFDIGSCYLTFPFIAKKSPKRCKAVNGVGTDVTLKVWDILIRKYYGIETEEDYRLRMEQCKGFSDLRFATALGFGSDNRSFVINLIIAVICRLKILPKADYYIRLFSQI